MLAVHARFYEAFEEQDLDTMSSMWLHDDSVACTHPGWRTLHGWASVSASWFALFTESAPIQFILTDEHAHVAGEVAWVTVDENIIGDEVGGTVAAVNVFRRIDDDWRMVVHHGSPVTRTTDPRATDPS